jgi:hypothetical protein
VSRLAKISALVSVVLAFSCTARLLRHNQAVAAAKAEEFLAHAVVKHDFGAAHRMLRDDAKLRVSEAALADVVRQQHPHGYPRSVRATEYEPVPGQAAIQIFLIGERDSEKFYYRVPMVGTVGSGYSPDGFYRGSGPYPASSLRQALPPQRAGERSGVSMFPAHVALVVLMALISVVSAVAKLRHDAKVVRIIHEVTRVPMKWFPWLAACELAGAAGLLAGLAWAPLGVAAAAGLVLYFVGAVVAHARVGDFKGIGTPLVPLLLAVGCLVTRVLTSP